MHLDCCVLVAVVLVVVVLVVFVLVVVVLVAVVCSWPCALSCFMFLEIENWVLSFPPASRSAPLLEFFIRYRAMCCDRCRNSDHLDSAHTPLHPLSSLFTIEPCVAA